MKLIAHFVCTATVDTYKKGKNKGKRKVTNDVKSLNSFAWSPRFIYSNYKKELWDVMFRTDNKPPLKPIEKPFIQIVRRLGTLQRYFDYDDFVGGCKPILDYLKEFKYIVDDSWKHIKADQLEYIQQAKHLKIGKEKVPPVFEVFVHDLDLEYETD